MQVRLSLKMRWIVTNISDGRESWHYSAAPGRYIILKMAPVRSLFSSLHRRLSRLPIFKRLLLGNSIVIVGGAIAGTLLIGRLAQLPAETDLWLILILSALGILLSLVINYWIVKTTLRPLHELSEMVDRVEAGRADEHIRLTADADPDISRLAAAISSMLDRLGGRTLQLRALSERAITAQEEERKRIARQLHDDTAQSLSTLIISLERLESAITAGTPDDLQARLAAARQLATRALEDLRKIIYGLRPTLLDDLGLVPAIRWYARASLEEIGVQVSFDTLDETTRLPPQLETLLFRIAQEAINNVVHHADAKSVVISLERDDGSICLRVEDDGRGFDVAKITGQALRLRRLGLLGIQERADLVGGEATVDSMPGRGTRLQVRMPLLEIKDGRDG